MSYDPNQEPDSGYGTPPYGAPQDPYGQSQGPYGAPQGPYNQQQPGPYGPPPQAPYGQPSYQQPGYGYVAPPAAPLPLGEAIRQLPSQYIKVLTKPSAATFAEEQGKAAWDIVWVQLLIYAVAAGVLGLLANVIYPGRFSTSSTNLNPGTIQAITLSTGLGLLILVPIGFFISVGIYYLIAKAFGGQGTFLTQSYNTLLFQVPIGIISYVANLVPILGGLVAAALGIYAIVLNIFSIMAVHRLSGGRATAVVLIPIAVLLVLVCILVIALFAFIAALIRSAQPHP